MSIMTKNINKDTRDIQKDITPKVGHVNSLAVGRVGSCVILGKRKRHGHKACVRGESAVRRDGCVCRVFFSPVSGRVSAAGLDSLCSPCSERKMSSVTIAIDTTSEQRSKGEGNA